jgi:phosphate transport system permease protein
VQREFPVDCRIAAYGCDIDSERFVPGAGVGALALDEPVEQRIRYVVQRTRGDRVYRGAARGAAVTVLLIMGLIGVFLVMKAWPALRVARFDFLTETKWLPEGQQFGIASLILLTFEIAIVALVIAVPVAIGAALFLTEYCPRALRRPLTSLVDLLAAVPSLIYGLWGLFFLQDRLRHVSEWLGHHLAFIPIFRVSSESVVSSTFIAGVVVALMVLPICTAVMREVFSQAPPGEKEGALALGATRWAMVRTVVLPFGRGGIVGGSMLGLGRALGETIAVAIIISPTFAPTIRILDGAGNSIAATIALRFNESSPFGQSALFGAGLALFAITLVVNALASIVVNRSRSGAATEI